MGQLKPPPFPAKTRAVFREYFKTELVKFTGVLLWSIGIYSFDIVRFDEYCQARLGYVEDGDTSLRDFLQAKYDDRAVALIEGLLKISSRDEIINFGVPRLKKEA